MINNLEKGSDIVAKYEVVLFDKKHVFIPHETSTDLLIVCTAPLIPEPFKYELLSKLYKDQRCNLLFLTNTNKTYYLDQDSGLAYQTLIEYYIEQFNQHECYIYGTSSGGSAALYFGIKLKINCIAVGFQSNKDITLKSKTSTNYGINVDGCVEYMNASSFKDLDILIEEEKLSSVLYLMYNSNPTDLANALQMNTAKYDSGIIVTEKTPGISHVVDASREALMIDSPNELYKRMKIISSFYDANLLPKIIINPTTRR